MAVGLPEDPSYPEHSPHTNHFFAVQPLNDCRRVARSLFKIDLSSLFSCLFLAYFLILLLLLMSGNVHPNPCPVFSSPFCPLHHLSFYLDLWQELFSVSSCSTRLQWVPGHLFLPGNDSADELAKRGVLLDFSAIPCSLFPLISRIHSSLFSNWRHTVSSKFFDTQIPSISTKELMLLRHACCVLSGLHCNKRSLLLSSYLFRIGRTENPFCRVCGHSSQGTSHSIVHCPATDSLRRSLFVNFLSLYDVWSRPWGVARLLELHGLLLSTHPMEEVG